MCSYPSGIANSLLNSFPFSDLKINSVIAITCEPKPSDSAAIMMFSTAAAQSNSTNRADLSAVTRITVGAPPNGSKFVSLALLEAKR